MTFDEWNNAGFSLAEEDELMTMSMDGADKWLMRAAWNAAREAAFEEVAKWHEEMMLTLQKYKECAVADADYERAMTLLHKIESHKNSATYIRNNMMTGAHEAENKPAADAAKGMT